MIIKQLFITAVCTRGCTPVLVLLQVRAGTRLRGDDPIRVDGTLSNGGTQGWGECRILRQFGCAQCRLCSGQVIEQGIMNAEVRLGG